MVRYKIKKNNNVQSTNLRFSSNSLVKRNEVKKNYDKQDFKYFSICAWNVVTFYLYITKLNHECSNVPDIWWHGWSLTYPWLLFDPRLVYRNNQLIFINNSVICTSASMYINIDLVYSLNYIMTIIWKIKRWIVYISSTCHKYSQRYPLQ